MIAVAALALFVQVASFVHLVAVEHVACEHGELVDVGRPSPAVAAHHDAEQSFHASSAAERSGHEHCLLSPMRRDRASVETRAPQSRILCCNQNHSPAQARVVVPAPIALILLAPKSSPPTV